MSEENPWAKDAEHKQASDEKKALNQRAARAIALGITLLLFGVFATFYQGRAYWGNGVIVGYEYPYAKYIFPFLIAGSVFVVFGVLLFYSLILRRRRKRP